MGRFMVTVVARLLGKDPQLAWEYTARWVIRFLLVVIVITIGFAGVGAVMGNEESGGQIAPAPVVTTLDRYSVPLVDAAGNVVGMSFSTPTAP